MIEKLQKLKETLENKRLKGTIFNRMQYNVMENTYDFYFKKNNYVSKVRLKYNFVECYSLESIIELIMYKLHYNC